MRKAASDIASILNPTHTIHTAVAGDLLIGRLPRAVALEFIRYGSHHHECKQTLPTVIDYASRGNVLNDYTPNLVYLHPAPGSGSIVVSRPANVPSIVVGHPEYTQRLTACWDKIAEIPDTSSYFTKLQHWWLSAPTSLSGKEHDTMLQTTKALKLQKAAAVGLGNIRS